MSADADLNNMWNGATQEIATIDPASENWKIQALPLARVKKIMKSEEIIMQELERERLRHERAEGASDNQERNNVKFMISGEAPVLMSKACELLIKDLSFRAWQHTERNRRRTLQRQDLHAAVGESEVYDFLIDIVPRVQAAQAPAATAATTMTAPDMSMMQASLPPGFQVPQIAQVTANLNQASMHQAQAMAASVGAPPAATQPAPSPAIHLGLDPGTNPPAGIIQYAQGVPTDALNHLVHPWDPTQMAFPHMPPESADVPAPAPNPVPTSAPAPPTHQHPQQSVQQPQHQQVAQHHQHHHQMHHQLPQQQQAQPQHQSQQAQQQPQQPASHQQWMDPSTMAAMGAAPSSQQAPGV